MFGECHSESPRLPSPWLSRSSGGSPSPLNLPSPNGSSSPTTPTDSTTAKGFRARRRSSLEELDLLDGLADEFQDCHLGKERDVGRGLATMRALPDQVTVVEIEQVAVLDASAVGLQPEVDHQGNIEYKLKIAMPTSIHRLEKLRTQLKWRLVEGGGTAIYELGLLDDGTLVGLNRDEMEQSLKTLAQMLAGLGGGRVQISRVIRIGREEDASSEDTNARRPSLFPSFDVLADDDDISFVASGTPAVVDPVTGETSIFPPPRIRGPTPYPIDRSNEQQAAFRRDKRDARRARRREAEYLVAASTNASSRAGSHSSLSSSSAASSLYSTRCSTPASSESQPPTPPISIPPRSFQTSYPAAIEPRAKPLKPPKPPRPTTARLRKSESTGAAATTGLDPMPRLPSSRPTAKKPRAAEPHVTPFKPVLPHEGAEVRYVVEAVVRKAGTPADSLAGAGRRRRKSSAGSGRSEEGFPAVRPSGARDEAAASSPGTAVSHSEEDELSENDDGSLLSGDEGWNYLDFDLSAVAAAATAAHAAASSTRPC